MDRRKLIETTYDDHDTRTLRDANQTLKTTYATDDSVCQTREQAEDQYAAIAETIRSELPSGDVLVDVATNATREQALSAIDLRTRYDGQLDCLVLDIDETLRTVECAENTLPVDVRTCLRAFWEDGTPVVVATGKPLEFVRGLVTQALGQEVVQSDRFSVVYEAGIGVYTPNAGERTKVRLSRKLPDDVRDTVEAVRRAVTTRLPDSLASSIHLEEKSFNVTILPNEPTGSPAARTVVDEALVQLLRVVGEVVTDDTEYTTDVAFDFYGSRDPEVGAVLRDRGVEIAPVESVPPALSVLEELDVVYYEADAVEVLSSRITKRSGVESAFETLSLASPFALVMGDSKTDQVMMEYAVETGSGIPAAPTHASDSIVEYVRSEDGFLFEPGHGGDPLRRMYAYNRLGALGQAER